MAKRQKLTVQEVHAQLEEIARAKGFERFIVLPHPSNKLSKNGRAFYLEENKLKQKLQAATMNQLQFMRNPGTFPRFYHIVWVYKGTRPDDDNVITRCKYARDSVAAFYGHDDCDLYVAGFPAVDFVHSLDLAGYVIIAFFNL